MVMIINKFIYRCPYCKERINIGDAETHKGGIEFINGYPTKCRQSDKFIEEAIAEFNPYMIYPLHKPLSR